MKYSFYYSQLEVDIKDSDDIKQIGIKKVMGWSHKEGKGI